MNIQLKSTTLKDYARIATTSKVVLKWQRTVHTKKGNYMHIKYAKVVTLEFTQEEALQYQ